MKYLRQIADGLEVEPVLEELAAHAQLWNQFTLRTEGYAPAHNAVSDIWVRYRAWAEWLEIKQEYEKHCRNGMPWTPDPIVRTQWAVADFVGEEHESVWYPAIDALPSLRALIFELMRFYEVERLGGVLITRIPPHGRVAAHIDRGWHASYYEKIAVQLQSAPGQSFCFEDGQYDCPPGSVYAFDNSHEHWVENPTDSPRMTCIICVRRDTRKPPLSRGTGE